MSERLSKVEADLSKLNQLELHSSTQPDRLNKLESEISSQSSAIMELSRELDYLRHQLMSQSPMSPRNHIRSSPNSNLMGHNAMSIGNPAVSKSSPGTGAGEIVRRASATISNSNGNANSASSLHPQGNNTVSRPAAGSLSNSVAGELSLIEGVSDSSGSRSASSLSDIKVTLLPPKALLRELVDLFFQRIHPCYPFLHPVKASGALHDIISQNLTDSPNPHSTPLSDKRKEYPLVLYSIVVVTLRFVPQFKLNDRDKERYYRSCKETVMLRSFAITDLDCLQALVILAIDLVGISNGPETWSIIPLICSAATHLGLSREPALFLSNSDVASDSNNESISAQSADILPAAENWQDLESRRRLFWVIYSLDRFSSVATAFSFKINSLEIDRLLPVRADLWTDDSLLHSHVDTRTRWLKTIIRKDYSINFPSNIDTFGYMVENLQILSSIHVFLKKPISIYSLQDVLDWQVQFRQLDIELDNWYKSLPPHLSSEVINDDLKDQLDPMVLMLQATYQTTVIRLNSAAGYSCLKSEFFTNSPSAAKRCLLAVSNVVALAKHVIIFGLGKYVGPHYAWALWVSARLLVVDCVTNYKSFPEDLEILLTGLKKLGRVWKVAARYYGLLTMVIDEELSLRSTARGSNALSRGDDDSPIDSMTGEHKRNGSSAQIMSDMRRNAYALDFLLSKQKKEQKKEKPTSGEGPVLKSSPANDNESIKSDEMDQESIISSFELSELMDGSNMNDIFDWFNWPRQSGKMGQKTPVQHSVGEYKNILSREEQIGLYQGESSNTNDRPDWMSM
ncbi:hypothetical protein AWJ20_306 [Sugiyamaella lignohabitans]|uniref:Xylanolytic transcriptional activator regulatory domain-containing protein n=1 Tax=Sugiyamaella lignohabitans TaxID=796027 RepID=A0A167CT01_9ASCO|nr:uncharacterized protein AWJ20_306 [Sugiyamaella lignohabitans]ANB12071.1 hypothetical protein AWJ20_306 [Sugiyamaella lignohabitans]